MIAWLNPGALWGLVAVAGPVLVHLLHRHRADRLPFPSLRFVRPSPVAAVRLHLPSDPLLLALRMAIVGLAAIAFAQPLLITAARVTAWNARVARVVVVDTSDSVRARGAAAAADAAAAELRTAAWASRLETADLPRGVRQAASRLITTFPARREIVVISDFQRGALTDRDFREAPASLGVRLVRVGSLPRAREFAGPMQLGDGAMVSSMVRLDGEHTSAALRATDMPIAGLDLVGPDEEIRGLWRVVARAGTPAPSGDQGVAVYFDGASPVAAVQPVEQAWMLRTILSMREDSDLGDLGDVTDAPDEPPWNAILCDRDGRPLVRATAGLDRLVIQVAAPASDLLSAAVVRAALIARAAGSARAEHEVLAIGDGELAAWSRAPAPVGAEAWRSADRSDARWCWALVAILLGIETLARRRHASGSEAHANAA